PLSSSVLSPMMPRPPSTPLFPYTTLFRSEAGHVREEEVPQAPAPGLPLQVLDDLRVVMGVASLGHLPPVDRLGRVHELLHELGEDRKSTRLNSSHVKISYAVFCLKKKRTH